MIRALALLAILVTACSAPAGDRRAADTAAAEQGAVVTNSAAGEATNVTGPAPTPDQ